jgi:hypothetical protein
MLLEHGKDHEGLALLSTTLERILYDPLPQIFRDGMDTVLVDDEQDLSHEFQDDLNVAECAEGSLEEVPMQIGTDLVVTDFEDSATEEQEKRCNDEAGRQCEHSQGDAPAKEVDECIAADHGCKDFESDMLLKTLVDDSRDVRGVALPLDSVACDECASLAMQIGLETCAEYHRPSSPVRLSGRHTDVAELTSDAQECMLEKQHQELSSVKSSCEFPEESAPIRMPVNTLQVDHRIEHNAGFEAHVACPYQCLSGTVVLENRPCDEGSTTLASVPSEFACLVSTEACEASEPNDSCQGAPSPRICECLQPDVVEDHAEEHIADVEHPNRCRADLLRAVDVQSPLPQHDSLCLGSVTRARDKLCARSMVPSDMNMSMQPFASAFVSERTYTQAISAHKLRLDSPVPLSAVAAQLSVGASQPSKIFGSKACTKPHAATRSVSSPMRGQKKVARLHGDDSEQLKERSNDFCIEATSPNLPALKHSGAVLRSQRSHWPPVCRDVPTMSLLPAYAERSNKRRRPKSICRGSPDTSGAVGNAHSVTCKHSARRHAEGDPMPRASSNKVHSWTDTGLGGRVSGNSHITSWCNFGEGPHLASTSLRLPPLQVPKRLPHGQTIKQALV